MARAAFRTRPERHFVVIRNAAMRDPSLSLKAKGMLALMMTFSESWTYYLSQLVELSADGRDATRQAVKELISAGYVKRERQRDDGGKLRESLYYVSDEKVVQDDASTKDGFSNVGFPNVGKSDTKKNNEKKTNEEERSSKAKRLDINSMERDAVAKVMVQLWNENCGPLPSVRTLTSARRKKLLKFYDEIGSEDALEMFEKAVKVVASDDFWRAKRLTLDNLLVDGRVVQKAEMAPEEKSEAKPNQGDIVVFVDLSSPRQPQLEGLVVGVNGASIKVRLHDGDKERDIPLGSVVQVRGSA